MSTEISKTVSRVMSRIIIYLVLLLPAVSSDLPESRPGKPVALCLVLLRMGFTCAPPVTRRAVVSYTAFPPLPGSAPQRIAPFRQRRGGIFLLHWPWSRLHRTLSGILPCEARTFLTCRIPKGIRTAAIIHLTYFPFNTIPFFFLLGKC